MAKILLVGTNAPLLEGLSQTLAAVGHDSRIAATMMEANELASADAPPLIAVIERELAMGATDVLRLQLQPGGTLILYRTESDRAAALSAPLQRACIADLTLPLERHRLIALVQHIAQRARLTRRGPAQTPPDTHAPFGA